MRSSEYDGDDDDNPFRDRPPLIWRLVMGVFKTFLVLVVMLILLLCAAYYMAQQKPEFYAKALDRKPEEAKALGSAMEQTVFDIYNSALVPDQWRGELSEDEINGWLASELLEKFPELLPDEIKAPRVELSKGKLEVACRCSYKDLEGIAVGEFDLFCTDKLNQIAIRIGGIKLGIVPFPVTQFADQITEGLQRSGYESSWTEQEGDPVLLIDVPEDHLKIDESFRVEVKSFDIEDQKMVITGETIEIESWEGVDSDVEDAGVVR